MKLKTVVCYWIAAVLAGTVAAQTRIDLRTQGKSVDFSTATSTLPSQIGATLPVTCQVGATFVLTTAAAGQNWYLCTSANQWTVQGAAAPSVAGNANTVLSTDGVSLMWKTLGGDITGPPTAMTVGGLLGRRLNATAPATGQVLAWDGAQWSAETLAGGGSVTSVFGRTGAVTAQSNDYSFAQIAGTVGSGQLPATGGDLSGAIASATVVKLRGQAIAATAPASGQVLTWSGTQWAPQNASGGVPSVFGRTGAITAQANDYNFTQIAGAVASSQLPSAGGDLSGGIASATVIKLQGQAIAATAPASGQVLTWSGTQWSPQNASGGVPSVFGRTGAVTAAAGDYTVSQITHAADITNSNSYSAGARQTFLAGATTAGIQIAPNPLPTTPSAGDLAMDSTDSNRLKVYNGSAWISLNSSLTSSAGNYVASFTSQTAVTVAGTTHGLGTSNLLVQCYDNATPMNIVEPSLITVDPSSYNVTMAFAQPLTGRCVINGSSGSSASSGAAGAAMTAQLGDFAATLTSATTLSIGAKCSTSTPCNVRFGTQVYSITAPAIVTVGGGTGTEYIYVAPTGTLTAGSSTLTASCAGCTVAPGINGFPINSMPLFTWTATSGTWDASGGVDSRGWLSSNPVLGGPGIATVATGGQTTISVDSAVVPAYLTASATLDFPLIAAGSCAADLTFALVGANPADAVAPGWPAGMEAGLSGTMRVSAAGVISVRLCADTTGRGQPGERNLYRHGS